MPNRPDWREKLLVDSQTELAKADIFSHQARKFHVQAFSAIKRTRNWNSYQSFRTLALIKETEATQAQKKAKGLRIMSVLGISPD